MSFADDNHTPVALPDRVLIIEEMTPPPTEAMREYLKTRISERGFGPLKRACDC